MFKIIYFTTLSLALTSTIVLGQGFPKEFGKISKDDFEFKEYTLDKDAEAVVLFDMAKSYFVQTKKDFDIVFSRTTRIKILSETGAKWAEVEIPFYQEGNIYEKVSGIKAYSYNIENGIINKSRIEATNIYDEKIDNNWLVKKFVIPNHY